MDLLVRRPFMSTVMPAIPCATIALLPWGNVFEDFLDTIGVSLETFCNEMTGGWLFGYVEALQLAGLRVVVIIFSTSVTSPLRLTHKPTGATIRVLPVTRIYHAVQQIDMPPHEQILIQSAGNFRQVSRFLMSAISRRLKKILPYLTTPVGLLARELRVEGYDAILCQEYEDPRFDLCLLLGILIGLPVFASFQGGVQERSGFGRLVRSLILRASAGLIIGPQTEARRVQARYYIPSTKLAQIFNPLDLQMWVKSDRNQARETLQIPPEAQVVVWHGRISIRHKGLDILLDAWEHICRQRSEQDLRLLLVGTGQDAEKFSQQLATRRLRGIHWINQYLHDRAEIQGYLAVGDVYAFASRYEGFPVAPLEAMACGLPIVATNVQGIADIFEGGEASGGIVVPPENAAELALALGRVLDDQTWGRELGQQARSQVEACFSLEAVGRQLRTFLLHGKSGH